MPVTASWTRPFSGRKQKENQIRTRQSSQLYTPVTLTQLLFQRPSALCIYLFALPRPTSTSSSSAFLSSHRPVLLPTPDSLPLSFSGHLLRFRAFLSDSSHRDSTPETHQTSGNLCGTRPQRIARGIKQLARDTRYVRQRKRRERENESEGGGAICTILKVDNFPTSALVRSNPLRT